MPRNPIQTIHVRAEAQAWRQTNHPQPWHGPDRDRDPWEPRPWEVDPYER